MTEQEILNDKSYDTENEEQKNEELPKEEANESSGFEKEFDHESGLKIDRAKSDPEASENENNEELLEDSTGIIPEENGDLNYETDLKELKEEFPQLKDLESTNDLYDPEKYYRFRSLGLTPKEAYLALDERRAPRKPTPPSPITVARRRGSISDNDLRMARAIFTNLSDREINALYQRVTK